MKTTRLLKGSKLVDFENKLRYEELTCKELTEMTYRALNMQEEAAKRISKLKEELKELEYQEEKYSKLWNFGRRAAEEVHGWLKVAGYPQFSNLKTCEKAFYEYDEIECYVGNPFQNSYRMEEDKFIEKTTIESCHYVQDFY